MATLRQRSMGRPGGVYAPQSNPTVNSAPGNNLAFSGSSSLSGNASGAAIVGALLIVLLVGHYYWTRSVQGGR